MRKSSEKSRTTIGGNQKVVDEATLPVLEVEKNNSLGMLIGVAGAMTYFGTLDQAKWRTAFNAKRVFEKYDALVNVDGADVEKAKKDFQTFFQSATAPVANISSKFKVMIKEANPVPASDVAEKASDTTLAEKYAADLQTLQSDPVFVAEKAEIEAGEQTTSTVAGNDIAE